MISLRLPNDIVQKLNKISYSEGISRTEVIKKAILDYFNKYENNKNSFEIGKDLFGNYELNNSDDLSETYKKKYRKILNDKISH